MELSFVLYLLSGILKSYFTFWKISVPIDLTALFGLLSLIALFIRNFKAKGIFISHVEGKNIFFPFILFWIWMLFSLIYTSSDNYSLEKALFFGTNFIPFLIIFTSCNFKIENFLKFFTITVIILLIIYIPYSSNYYNRLGNIAEIRENILRLYLMLGQCLGAIILTFLTKRSTVFHPLVDKLLIVLCLFLLIIIGARGPLIFTIVCSLLYLCKNFNFKSLPYLTKTFIGIVLITLVFIVFTMNSETIITLFDHSIGRMSLIINGFLSEGDMGNSVNSRVKFYNDAFDLINKSYGNLIFGTGIGSYLYETAGIDGKGYPHNIMLEIWCELGIIGVFIFTYFLLTIFKINSLRRNYITVYIVLYYLLEYGKSASLIDIRIGITFILLYTFSGNLMKRKNSQRTLQVKNE